MIQSDEEDSQNINYFSNDKEADNLFLVASSISLHSTRSHLPSDDSFYTVVNMCLEEPATEKVFMCFVKKIDSRNSITLFVVHNVNYILIHQKLKVYKYQRFGNFQYSLQFLTTRISILNIKTITAYQIS